jgi:hypothetical protein
LRDFGGLAAASINENAQASEIVNTQLHTPCSPQLRRTAHTGGTKNGAQEFFGNSDKK